MVNLNFGRDYLNYLIIFGILVIVYCLIYGCPVLNQYINLEGFQNESMELVAQKLTEETRLKNYTNNLNKIRDLYQKYTQMMIQAKPETMDATTRKLRIDPIRKQMSILKAQENYYFDELNRAKRRLEEIEDKMGGMKKVGMIEKKEAEGDDGDGDQQAQTAKLDQTSEKLSSDEWQCIPNISFPVRINKSGDVECMSKDGRDCLWDGVCSQKLNTNKVACGTELKQKWGITGYDNPGHWCSLARTYFKNEKNHS